MERVITIYQPAVNLETRFSLHAIFLEVLLTTLVLPLLKNLVIFIQTMLPVEDITSTLAKKGYEVMTSEDAGRFVCNYVYYHSLWFAEQHGTKSLFVHVPLFSTINEETQMQFVASLLEVLASSP